MLYPRFFTSPASHDAAKVVGRPYDAAATYSKVQADVRRELQNTYRPEFLNRLDEIIVFRPLSRPEVGRITELMLASVQSRAGGKGVAVHVDDKFKNLLLSEGFSPKFGARPMRR